MSDKSGMDEEKDEIDEYVHMCASYFAICAAREHPGLFSDLEEIEIAPYLAVRLELPLQAEYSAADVDETCAGIQNLLFLSQQVLIRYSIVRKDQEG